MGSVLKRDLVNRLKQVGAFDVRIADPRVGYDDIRPGKHPDNIWEPLSMEHWRRHPLDLWKECRSVVVFAFAFPPQSNNTYLGPYAPWQDKDRLVGPVPENIQSEKYAMDRLSRLFAASITLKGMTFLKSKGYNVSLEYCSGTMPGLKLSAYESGLGVYGRFGIIIHPVLGSRISLGGILTDAVLEPDGRLEDFNPCENCDLCIRICPAEAIDPNKNYPYSYNRAKCNTKRREIAQMELYCHNCYAVCPAQRLEDEELLCIKEAKSFYKPHRLKHLQNI